MSWLVSAKQYIPAVIGEPWGGGYFAGYISHTADGNPTHALIVAPRATGASGNGYTLTTVYSQKIENTSTPTANSTFDGRANTDAMAALGLANFPAAQFCVNLSIGGYTDWYLPARDELDIAYFNLKPTTGVNFAIGGINTYAVPPRNRVYRPNYPTQTSVPAFSTTAEGFVADLHWSSLAGVAVSFDSGYTLSFSPVGNANFRTRAFRRIAL